MSVNPYQNAVSPAMTLMRFVHRLPLTKIRLGPSKPGRRSVATQAAAYILRHTRGLWKTEIPCGKPQGITLRLKARCRCHPAAPSAAFASMICSI